MRTRLSRVAGLVTGVLAMAGCDAGTVPTEPATAARAIVTVGDALAAGATTDHMVISIPVGFTIQASAKAAIAACVGETVTLGGDARYVAHTTTHSDGSLVLDRLHINPQGATATGNTSGRIYRLVGADNNGIVMTPAGGMTATFSASLRVISPSTTPNFTAHILQHITVTSDGAVTSFIDVFDVDCG